MFRHIRQSCNTSRIVSCHSTPASAVCYDFKRHGSLSWAVASWLCSLAVLFYERQCQAVKRARSFVKVVCLLNAVDFIDVLLSPSFFLRLSLSLSLSFSSHINMLDGPGLNSILQHKPFIKERGQTESGD